MQIVIVGAGISGLATCLLLKKHLLSDPSQQYTVIIIDAYDVNLPATSQSAKIAPHSAAAATNASTNDDDAAFTPTAIGSAIGISQNGLAVLERLDENGSILEEVKRRGHSIKQWNIGDARGWQKIEFGVAAPSTTAKQKKAQKSSSAHAHHDEETTDAMTPTVMITRQTMWEILRDAVLRCGFPIEHKKVIGIDVATVNDHERPPTTVHCADGSSMNADLVIGADGLRSIVRRRMFRDETQALVPDRSWVAWLKSWVGRPAFKIVKVDYITPCYEGLVGVAGFVPSPILTKVGYEPGTMRISFGPNGFFGYGNVTSDTPESDGDDSSPQAVSAWWSTFGSESPYPYSSTSTTSKSSDRNSATAAADASASSARSRADGGSNPAFAADRALSDLLARHRWWKDPAIQAILDHCEVNGVNQCYPTYTTPELPTWEKSSRLVLVGDAAHTIQPSSGQGASQGLEDAESLVLLLKHYLGQASTAKLPGEEDISTSTSTFTTTIARNTGKTAPASTTIPVSFPESTPMTNQALAIAIQSALAKYVTLRKPRVHKIHERAQKMGSMKNDMSFPQEMLMYLFFWAMKFMRDDYPLWLFGYDVPSEVARIIQDD